MKNLILGLAVIALSVILTLVVREDNGYFLIGYGQWTVESSLAFFLLMDLILYTVRPITIVHQLSTSLPRRVPQKLRSLPISLSRLQELFM